ncbi:MAG TPA: SDR family NAD(P)-dependent oxidoreductase [Caulobacteraceae bacterium]|jgi:NAD(P)-dependent dehydrogenase (short-subunit alcohol dehydrogenase family)|nr:SDR family NAD(P)-dependent oxidoreductase [Caulobacteraceae bacterium]
MNGKTVVITGATSGIGEAAALALAGTGARIVFVARDAAKARTLLDRLTRANPDAAHDFVLGDLSTLAGMRSAGEALKAKAPHIDVLVNNAGAIFEKREETADGLEKTFAVNHMAYFVITEILRPNLDPDGGRIVSTASGAHMAGRPDFDDLQMTGRYSGMTAYGNSKLYNILWTHELARRLRGSRVTANCFHPGGVATGFGSNNKGLMKTIFKLASPILISPEKGADTLVWLASSSEAAGKSGGYYVRRRLTLPSAAARDEASGHRLWAESEKIAGSTLTEAA